jgi:hypothetical protein
MRKVPIETLPHESEMRVIEALLSTVQKTARKKLFDDRISLDGVEAEWWTKNHIEIA